MLLLNFSHPLTSAQLDQIESLIGQRVARLITLSVQFDNSQPFLPQLQALLENMPITSQQLQTEPLLVNLPALNFITAMLLAELHGLMGYFPSITRIRPVPEITPPRYEVAEIINLQAVREAARERR